MFGDFLGSFQILCFLSQHVGKIWAILFQHLVTLPVRQKRFTTLVPGVHFSMPFITRVEQINVRLVTENVPPIEISTNDGVSANFVDVQVWGFPFRDPTFNPITIVAPPDLVFSWINFCTKVAEIFGDWSTFGCSLKVWPDWSILKELRDIFSCNSSPDILWLLDYFEKMHFCQTAKIFAVSNMNILTTFVKAKRMSLFWASNQWNFELN